MTTRPRFLWYHTEDGNVQIKRPRRTTSRARTHARTHARSTHARTHAHKVVGQGPDSPSHLHSRTYDYQHQPEAQTRLEARGTQLNWITASEEMVQDSGRADSCRSEVQQAPSPSGA